METPSSSELVILGLLKRQPAHGYELYRIVRRQRMSEYIAIEPNQIYRVLARLEDQGYVMAQMGPEGTRPERPTYGLTSKGEARVAELLLKHLQVSPDNSDPFVAAITFGDLAPRQVLFDELRQRREIVLGAREDAEQLLEQSLARDEEGQSFARLRLDRWIEHLKAEEKWLDRAIAELEGSRALQALPPLEKRDNPQISQGKERWGFGEAPPSEVFPQPDDAAEAFRRSQRPDDGGEARDPRLNAWHGPTDAAGTGALTVGVLRQHVADIEKEVLQPTTVVLDPFARVGEQALTYVEPATPLFAREFVPAGVAIEVQDLRKSYGHVKAIDGISFRVLEKEIFGILGPNGAGKTTTMEILEGMRRADAGTAVVAGVDVRRDPRKVKSLIGVQLQSSAYLANLSLIELLELFASLYNRRVDARDLLRRVGLLEKAKSVFFRLSGGQKQRFSIAAALVNQPRILFLDEPTTGLDPQGRRNLWELVRSIRSEGRTVVITTHYMEEAETLCDRVAVMDRGKIIALDQPETMVRRLLAMGFRRQRVEREANLEDVFIALTGRALREN